MLTSYRCKFYIWVNSWKTNNPKRSSFHPWNGTYFSNWGVKNPLFQYPWEKASSQLSISKAGQQDAGKTKILRILIELAAKKASANLINQVTKHKVQSTTQQAPSTRLPWYVINANWISNTNHHMVSIFKFFYMISYVKCEIIASI